MFQILDLRQNVFFCKVFDVHNFILSLKVMIYRQPFTRNFFQNNVDNLKLISNNSLAIKISTKIEKNML
ncbi:MAG TPA: hypothetical protein DDW74_06100 [Porphyromonadaceae bacterium]|nr:hypothetical protein [Porphyromonadaceae bacterium]